MRIVDNEEIEDSEIIVGFFENPAILFVVLFIYLSASISTNDNISACREWMDFRLLTKRTKIWKSDLFYMHVDFIVTLGIAITRKRGVLLLELNSAERLIFLVLYSTGVDTTIPNDWAAP